MTGFHLSKTFQSGQGACAWMRTGAGEPIVLVHGTPANAALWRGVVPLLAENFEVIVHDLCGYGCSEKHEGQDVRLRAHAKTLAALIDHLGLKAPHLVGHDFGGAAVLGAHLVEGVAPASMTIFDAVALNPWGTEYSLLVKDNIEVFNVLPAYVHEAALEAHLRTAVFHPLGAEILAALLAPWCGPEGQRAYYRQIAQYDHDFTADLETLYPRTAAPVQILWGARDTWVTPDTGRRLHDLIPESSYELLPDAGHFAMLDSPGALAARIAAFARSQRA